MIEPQAGQQERRLRKTPKNPAHKSTMATEASAEPSTAHTAARRSSRPSTAPKRTFLEGMYCRRGHRSDAGCAESSFCKQATHAVFTTAFCSSRRASISAGLRRPAHCSTHERLEETRAGRSTCAGLATYASAPMKAICPISMGPAVHRKGWSFGWRDFTATWRNAWRG